MPFCHQPISPWPCAAEACLFPIEDPGAGTITEAPAVYRPGHPERSAFYQLFENHFDSYVRCYEERFESSSRVISRAAQDAWSRATPPSTDNEDSEFLRERRRTWARLLRKIFEVDPMLCSCGAEMKIISIITEPRVVDRILRHLESERCKARDPFESRAPPPPAALPLS
jgi:hypothetical protein